MKKRRKESKTVVEISPSQFYCVSIRFDTLRGSLNFYLAFLNDFLERSGANRFQSARYHPGEHAGCYIEREDKTSEPAFSFFERAASVFLSCEFPSIGDTGVSGTDPRSHRDESQ